MPMMAALAMSAHRVPHKTVFPKNNGDQTSVSVDRSYCCYFLAAFFLAGLAAFLVAFFAMVL